MPPVATYHPLLSDLIDASAIPGELAPLENFANGVIEDLLGNLTYRDYLVTTSPDNDTRFYSLTILTDEGQELIPADLPINLMFNPDDTGDRSKFDIAFDWSWPISRYFAGFESEGFSYAPKAFVEILFELAGIEDEADFFKQILNSFIGDDFGELQSTVLSLKTKLTDLATDPASSSLLSPLTGTIDNVLALTGNIIQNTANVSLIDIVNDLDSLPITSQELDDFNDAISAGLTAFEDFNDELGDAIDAVQLILETVLELVTNLDDAKNRLLALFSNWLGNITWSDLEDLLVPQFSIGLNNVGMGMTFTREWLVPLDSNDQPKETGKSVLSFTAGSVEYSTQTGFHFNLDPLNANINFTKSMIGETGLILEIEGAKIDLSKTENIAEADAEGRPVDFQGVYAKKALIGLPEKWFRKDAGGTINIVGRNLLIGTGGLSGTLGLEYNSANPSDPPSPVDETSSDEMKFTLGPKDKPNGFALGFKKFEIEFNQGSFVGTDIKLNLYIPKLAKDENGNDKPIAMTMSLDHDGDFDITAKWSNKNVALANPPKNEVGKGIIGIPSIFLYKIDYVSVGRETIFEDTPDEKSFVYLETAGELHFTHSIIKTVIKDPIVLKKLRINSDGSIEIKGGSIPLDKNQEIKIGPAKISITAIHCGTLERDGKTYRYWGFDGGLSVNPGGVDARGDGIKFCYDPDNPSDWFLHIEGIGINIIIPSSSSKEDAALLLKGYLSLKDPVYEGSISIKMPKLKIAGGAEMKYDTETPAFIIDAWLELSKAIPLANTGLGIYGFRGLFGMRYVASRTAPSLGLDEDSSWFDWYTADPTGVNINKFVTPDEMPENAQVSNPFTIGAGISLATQADSGKTFSTKLMLLVSIPTLILLDGRANIMGERVGLDDEDPPFWAFISFSPTDRSIELGIGADYKLPKENGRILDLKAAIEAGFFFEDSSAWYVNFGTKDKPTSARLLSLFDAYSYLMLSARGIDAGAGVEFKFSKSYAKVVSVNARAYFDVWGYVSFESPQIGGGIAVGGHLDIKLFGFGLNVSLAAILTVEAAQPFKVAGAVEVCVGVNLRIKKIEKCFSVEFVWMKSQTVDQSPVPILLDPSDIVAGLEEPPFPATARHMQSGRTYEGALKLKRNGLGHNELDGLKPIPLDTFIDFQFLKPVKPNSVSQKIAGLGNGPKGDVEVIPPRSSSWKVTHSYSLDNVQVEIFDGSNWVDYNPFRALYPAAANDIVGMWQKSGLEYNKIRFLATNPFSYMDPIGGYETEGMGLDAHSLFCAEKPQSRHCMTWQNVSENGLAETGTHYHGGVFYEIIGEDGEINRTTNPFGVTRSLIIPEGNEVNIWFEDAVAELSIKMGSCVNQVEVIFESKKFAQQFNPNIPEYEVIAGNFDFAEIPGSRQTKTRSQLSAPITYNGTVPVDRIRIVPVSHPEGLQDLLDEFVANIKDTIIRLKVKGNEDMAAMLEWQLSVIFEQMDEYLSAVCRQNPDRDKEELRDQQNQIDRERENIRGQLDKLKEEFDCACPVDEAKFEDYFKELELDSTLKPSTEVPDLSSKPCQMTNDMKRAMDHVRNIQKLRKELSRESALARRNFREGLKEISTNCDDLEKQMNVLHEQLADLNQQSQLSENALALLGQPDESDERTYQCGCATFVHEVCWLTSLEKLRNESLPSAVDNQNDLQSTIGILNETLPPIWRPYHKYRIVFDVTDNISGPGGSTAPQETFYLGFKTDGPIGYFENENVPGSKVAIGTDDFPPAGETPGVQFDDKSVQAPETQLKYYVDELRSFPDPSGKTSYAKQLYYTGSKIDLAFKHRYAKHFFTQWPEYIADLGHAGIPARDFEMVIKIIDPAQTDADGSLPDIAQPVTAETERSGANVAWVSDPKPAIGPDVKTLQNLMSVELPDNDCCPDITETIEPPSQMVEAELLSLLPSKTYTAVICNKEVGLTAKDPKIIMRYPFTTSRYESFEAHVKSYEKKYKDEIAQAFFIYDITLTAPDRTRAISICTNQEADINTIYQDPFDSLIYGIFGIMDIDPPTSTEINYINDTDIDGPIGIWVRSAEPFNDPRLDSGQLSDTAIWQRNASPSSATVILFSKDRTQFVILRNNSTGKLQTTNTSLKLTRKEWVNGDLQETQSITIPIEFTTVLEELGR